MNATRLAVSATIVGADSYKRQESNEYHKATELPRLSLLDPD